MVNAWISRYDLPIFSHPFVVLIFAVIGAEAADFVKLGVYCPTIPFARAWDARRHLVGGHPVLERRLGDAAVSCCLFATDQAWAVVIGHFFSFLAFAAASLAARCAEK